MFQKYCIFVNVATGTAIGANLHVGLLPTLDGTTMNLFVIIVGAIDGDLDPSRMAKLENCPTLSDDMLGWLKNAKGAVDWRPGAAIPDKVYLCASGDQCQMLSRRRFIMVR